MGTFVAGEGYPMRGALAKDLFVTVRSTLAPVAQFMAFVPPVDTERSASEVAAEIVVTADSAAPRKRFLVHEYYTRIEWRSATLAEVQTNGATGSIEWTGNSNEVLRAELRIFPEGAPESLGMFLRLLTSILLPSRRAALVHASGVVSDGEAILFLGESGAGKTTTARRVGREGTLRFADDMAIVRISPQGTITVEACCFDRGGRLPGRENRCWPLRAAYDVRKAASMTRDLGRVKDPLATWCGAILSSTGPPGSLHTLLGLAGELCTTVSPRTLAVSATGPVYSTIAATHSEQARSIRKSTDELNNEA